MITRSAQTTIKNSVMDVGRGRLAPSVAERCSMRTGFVSIAAGKYLIHLLLAEQIVDHLVRLTFSLFPKIPAGLSMCRCYEVVR